MKKIVLATANPHKAAELKEILSGLKVSLAAINEYPGFVMPEENAVDFAGNAALKAKAVSLFTGEIALADDSGLEVEALGGRPGVHSARYSGPDADYAANNRLLLKELEAVLLERRKARFVTVVAISVPGKKTLFAEGVCPGLIATAPRGTGGFGYDPLFIYEPLGFTFAEMTAAEKNKVSHRAKALQAARALLEELLV